VAIRAVREQLFAAAERVLLRDGSSALTSRAVTTEAGVAKGVLHRHFEDFDAFLAELVLDRVNRMNGLAIELRAAAGTGAVVDNLTGALTAVFSSVAVAMVPLLIFRDELRARLRKTWPTGIPVLTEAAAMISGYLEDERARGRIAADADVTTLALTLIGGGHMLYGDRDSLPTETDGLRKTVTAVVGGVLR
jgi:AcrR family transcriptional regulator